MKKIISLLLVLVLALSMIPMAAAAATMPKLDSNRYITYTDKDGRYFIADSVTGEVVFSNTGAANISENYLHDHAFGFMTNRDGHFIGCSCGLRGAVDPHDDPLTAEDGKCWCGYTYMDNAEINVLWFSGMTISPTFHRSKTEHTAKVWNPNTTELKGTLRTFDARATVEWPEDLTIKEGTNVFKFKVTAEDGKTTKTYTLTVEK